MDFEAVWLIFSEQKRDVGGGICVDCSGLIISSCFLLRDALQVQGRCGSTTNSEFRDLEIVDRNRSLGLALLGVLPKNSDAPDQNEKFSYITLNHTLKLNRCEDIYAILHQGWFPFSSKKGNICFPFPLDTKIVLCTSREEEVSVMSRSTLGDEYNGRIRVMCEPCRVRDVGCVIDEREEDTYHVYIAENLHPDLPLVQVHGIRWADGSIGCPIFLQRNQEYIFVGLLCFEKFDFEFAIPSPILFHFLDSVAPLDPSSGKRKVSRASEKRKRESDQYRGDHKRGGQGGEGSGQGRGGGRGHGLDRGGGRWGRRGDGREYRGVGGEWGRGGGRRDRGGGRSRGRGGRGRGQFFRR